MRRWALTVALLVAVWFPVPSPAEEGGDSGDSKAAAAADDEAAAAEDAPEASAPDAEASEEAPEASGDEAAAPEEASSDAGQASGGDDEEESSFAPVLEYVNNAWAQFLTGLNGILTAPADPVMAAVHPPKALDKGGYARRPLGFASGVLLMAYRTVTGTLDLPMAFLPVPVLSPVPRYKLIPGFEHEDE